MASSDRQEGTSFKSRDFGVPMLGLNANGNYSVVDLSTSTPLPVSTGHLNVPSVHTAAALGPTGEWAAVTDQAHVLPGVAYSYAGSSSLPSATAPGRLTVADGSDTIFDLDIPASGVNTIIFTPPLQGTPGRTMTITLADGGASVQGKLNALGHVMKLQAYILFGMDFSKADSSQNLALI